MVDRSQFREHMDAAGSDGQHVGTVDRIEGQRLKLTKSDPASGGQHHYIELASVEGVADGAVRLARTANEARKTWQ